MVNKGGLQGPVGSLGTLLDKQSESDKKEGFQGNLGSLVDCSACMSSFSTSVSAVSDPFSTTSTHTHTDSLSLSLSASWFSSAHTYPLQSKRKPTFACKPWSVNPDAWTEMKFWGAPKEPTVPRNNPPLNKDCGKEPTVPRNNPSLPGVHTFSDDGTQKEKSKGHNSSLYRATTWEKCTDDKDRHACDKQDVWTLAKDNACEGGSLRGTVGSLEESLSWHNTSFAPAWRSLSPHSSSPLMLDWPQTWWKQKTYKRTDSQELSLFASSSSPSPSLSSFFIDKELTIPRSNPSLVTEFREEEGPRFRKEEGPREPENPREPESPREPRFPSSVQRSLSLSFVCGYGYGHGNGYGYHAKSKKYGGKSKRMYCKPKFATTREDKERFKEPTVFRSNPPSHGLSFANQTEAIEEEGDGKKEGKDAEDAGEAKEAKEAEEAKEAKEAEKENGEYEEDGEEEDAEEADDSFVCSAKDIVKKGGSLRGTVGSLEEVEEEAKEADGSFVCSAKDTVKKGGSLRGTVGSLGEETDTQRLYKRRFPRSSEWFAKTRGYKSPSRLFRSTPLLICTTCGKWGHAGTHCKLPITSYGLIVYRHHPETHVLQYLMICRKDGYGYIDYVRGLYSPYNVFQLQNIVDQMSLEEKHKIVHMSFYKMWHGLWVHHNNESEALKKAKRIRDGIFIQGKIVTLQQLIAHSPTQWTECEWEFPKGRRNYQEDELTCALREFEEETGIPSARLQVLSDMEPVEEIFVGSNHKAYKNKYFVAHCTDTSPLHQYFPSRSEVSQVCWKTLEECTTSIRSYHFEKKQVIAHVDQCIQGMFHKGT